MKIGFQKKVTFKITTPDIICDLFSFLDKDQIERIQIVSQFWNNVIICHKNILPHRQFLRLNFYEKRIDFYATEEDLSKNLHSYIIKFDGTNLSKIEENLSKLENLSSRYSQLTVDEILKNFNDVVFDTINWYSKDRMDNLFNLMKIVTTKTGSRFRGRYGECYAGRFGSKLGEIFDNYIIVDKLTLGIWQPHRDSDIGGSYIRKICANPEITQLPSTPKAIRLARLKFNENEELLHFTCNGKLNRANRVSIELKTSDTNYGNFIQQWFKLYRKHENPISLVGKFELRNLSVHLDIVLDAVKTFLNNTQLRVKYSLEESHRSFRGVTYQYLKRRCVLHETDSYALVIEMKYLHVTDMSSINASDLDQPPCKKMQIMSFCVKSL